LISSFSFGSCTLKLFRPFQTCFRYAYVLYFNLSLLKCTTRNSIIQKVPNYLFRLFVLVSSRFQVFFTLLCKTFKLSLTVLIRYRCVIVFSLARWFSPSFGITLGEFVLKFFSNKLFISFYSLYYLLLSYRTYLLWLFTATLFGAYTVLYSDSFKDNFMGYQHFRSPLLTLSLLIYFPLVTKMFQFTRYFYYLFRISP